MLLLVCALLAANVHVARAADDVEVPATAASTAAGGSGADTTTFDTTPKVPVGMKGTMEPEDTTTQPPTESTTESSTIGVATEAQKSGVAALRAFSPVAAAVVVAALL